MSEATATILSLDPSSPWVIILVVSLVTFPIVRLLRGFLEAPGGVASGIFLLLPLALPLVAAVVFAGGMLPEVAVLRPAGTTLIAEGRDDLLQFLLFSDHRTEFLIPYVVSSSPGSWLLWVGLAATSFFLARRVLGMLGTCRLLRACHVPETDVAARVDPLVARLARSLKLRRRPQVLIIPAGERAAVAMCARRGRILLSEDLLDRLDDAELEAVLAHEIAHIQARDVALMLGAGLLRDVVAWNPIAHLAFRRLSKDREFEADRRAAALVGDPLPVASSLLKVYELRRRAPKPRLHAGVAFFRPRGSLARRVARLLALADGARTAASMGSVPFVAAACLAAVVGLQAGARIAGQDDAALVFVWGAPDVESVSRWEDAALAPKPHRDATSKGAAPHKHKKERIPAGLSEQSERLLLSSVAVKKADLSSWMTMMAKIGKTHGVSPATLRAEFRSGWTAVPVITDGWVGPLGIYKVERRLSDDVTASLAEAREGHRRP